MSAFVYSNNWTTSPFLFKAGLDVYILSHQRQISLYDKTSADMNVL